jgi:hypothetical protein
VGRSISCRRVWREPVIDHLRCCKMQKLLVLVTQGLEALLVSFGGHLSRRDTAKAELVTALVKLQELLVPLLLLLWGGDLLLRH